MVRVCNGRIFSFVKALLCFNFWIYIYIIIIIVITLRIVNGVLRLYKLPYCNTTSAEEAALQALIRILPCWEGEEDGGGNPSRL